MFSFWRISSVIVVLVGLAGDGMADKPVAAPGLAPEGAAMGKAMAGTWTCKGQGTGRDRKLTEMTATSKWTVEKGGWWLHEAFEGTMGNEPGHSFDGYITYDAGAKKWKRVMIT